MGDKAFRKNSKYIYICIYIYIFLEPYLDTNSSKQVEYTKAFELTIIKELGKLTLVTSG